MQRILLSGDPLPVRYQFGGDDPPAGAFDCIVAGDEPVEITGVRVMAFDFQGLSRRGAEQQELELLELWLGAGMMPSIKIMLDHLWRVPWPLELWLPPRQSLWASVHRRDIWPPPAAVAKPLLFSWRKSARQVGD